MKIGVVIVTYNRLDKLKRCLESYDTQSYVPTFVCVIDNHSTDGTSNFLDSWVASAQSPFTRIVHHCSTNLGGSGGFCKGIETALSFESDWIWLADDDAYPTPNCLEQLYHYYTSLTSEEQAKIASLCSKVVDNNGISPLHRRYLCRQKFQIKEIPVTEHDYTIAANEITFFSFVGTAIRTDIIRKVGLPYAEYFIFYDDSEYSLRVLQHGKIVCISSAVILHDSPENTIVSYNWKNYYMVRNKLHTYRLYFNKYYCFVEYIKNIVMIFRYYNTPKSWKQFFHASLDVLRHKLGKCQKYLPS